MRSQARISKLASDDLQSKLTQAFGEREELARKLQLAEEALREKVKLSLHELLNHSVLHVATCSTL